MAPGEKITVTADTAVTPVFETGYTLIPSLIDGVEIKKYITERGISLVVEQAGSNPDDLYLYKAIYDNAGRLASAGITDFVRDGNKMTVTFSEPALNNGEEYGIYVWDSGLRPYICAIRSGE